MRRSALLPAFVLCALLALAGAAHAATTEQIHNDAGLVKFYRAEYAEAIADFQRALAMNPNYAEAHYNLGRCLEKQGDLKGAMAKFDDALRVQPAYSAARAARDRARKNLDARQKKEAAAGRRFKVNVSPELSIPLDDFSEAFYAFYASQTDRSRDLYRAMERDAPGDWKIPFEQGIICYELKMYADAITRFGIARDRAPDNVHVLHCLGLAYEKGGDPERAVALFRSAAEKNPSFAPARERTGDLAVSLARDLHEAARRAYEKQDWKTAAEKIDAALKYVSPGTADEAEMRNLQSLVRTRVGDVAQKYQNIRDAFLSSNHTYDEVYESGRVRYTGDNVIWTGVVDSIHVKGGETVLVVAQTGDRGVSSDDLIGSGICKAKFFQVHCGKVLAKDGRLVEDSFVEVYAKVRGPESLIDGYKVGCTAPIPGLTAYKIVATSSNASGTLVLEPLN